MALNCICTGALLKTMKIRILILSAVFALVSSVSQAQTLTTAAQAAFANAGGDLAKIAAVAKAYPAEAAAIARAAAKANPANAAQIAATVVKAVAGTETWNSRQAIQNIVSEVVKEVPTVEAAGAIAGSVISALGATNPSNLGLVRNIASAAVSALPADVKTPSNLKTFVQIVQSTGAPESAARMGAYDGSGVGIVTINRATPDAAKVAAGTAAITTAVNAANTAITNMVPLPGTSQQNTPQQSNPQNNNQNNDNQNNNNNNPPPPQQQPLNPGDRSG